jgi:GNAT superfamily N-acetyltransferase
MSEDSSLRAKHDSVRAVRREDHAAWLPLWHGYNVFYGRAEGAPAEVTAATWGRFFDAYEPLWALVAEDEDGRLLGFTHYLYHRNTNHIQPVCYLEDLFTAEAARGKGVGRALIAAVCAAAKADGIARVYWLTQEHNATARRLYDKVAEKSEFVVYGKEV